MSDSLLNGGAGGQGGGDGGAAGGAGGQGAGAGPAWLPDEYRADAMFKDFQDVGALAKSYRETKTFVGADKADLLRLPKEPDAPEWNDVHKALGRPDKPEEYKLPVPEGTAPEVVTAFGAAAHKLGLSTKQASEVMGFYGKAVADQVTAREAQAVQETTTTETALKAEWGQAYPEKVHAITRLLVNAGGDEALAAFNEAGGGRNPILLRTFAKIAEGLAEPGALRGGSGGGLGGGTLTPADAQAKIGEKRRDGEFMKAYNTRDHGGHAAALKEMNDLYMAAYPT